MAKGNEVNWPPKEKGFKPAPRPTSVKVGHLEYAILWIHDKDWRGRDDTSNDNIGEHNGPLATIKIRVVPDVHEQYFRETLWHEIMHAVWLHCDFNEKPAPATDDQEENIIARTSFVFITVLQENPEVVAYLSAQLFSTKVNHG